jgi:S-adenosylmethionine:tRNA ribosyltransferase-isomerase
MQKTDFHYDLPQELIAQYPLAQRDASRLLVLDGKDGAIQHRRFIELPDLLQAGDVVIFNDTQVIPARLYGKKETSGQVELLVERILSENRVLAQLRASKSPKVGTVIHVSDGIDFSVIGRRGDFYELRASKGRSVQDILDVGGHVPLPPYIDRKDEINDRDRYQTVYASRPGAVAAPTAGLHFDDAMLTQLDRLGVQRAFLTLHVGAGTFQPVRTAEISKHRMHLEYLEIGEQTAKVVNAAKAEGRRVIAVGTTVARALETAVRRGEITSYKGETNLFIYPAYDFKIIDGLLTNFHLPESTLLMLVCAFAGTDPVMKAYRLAVRKRYRFYSYGDAMFLTPCIKY